MKLSEIFAQLTYGEFSQLCIGGSEQGKINESNYPAVLSHINLGLTALFCRFNLKEGRVVLRPVDGQTVYTIDSKFAKNNKRSREDVRYLMDSAQEPFNDDTLIKIERVLDASGVPLPLNKETDPRSCFTPALNVLRIPADLTGDLTLVYRQNHPQLVIPFGVFDPSRTEVDLPYTHLEALLYFVASRAHNPVGMQNEFHKGNSYAAKYEAACALLEDRNVKPDQGWQNTRLERNGWV